MYKFLLSLGMLFVASTAHSASLEAKIQEKYQGINTIKTTFEQTLVHKESGSIQKRKGELFFKKPFLVRWETKNPYPELLLITNSVVWNFLPDEEVAYKYTPDIVEGSRPLVQVITGQAELSKDFEVKNMGKDGSYTKLHLYPHDPSPDMVEAFLWIDDKTLIRKATITDFYGNTNSLHFTNVNVNASLPASTFSFTPPKGVDVENGMRQ